MFFPRSILFILIKCLIFSKTFQSPSSGENFPNDDSDSLKNLMSESRVDSAVSVDSDENVVQINRSAYCADVDSKLSRILKLIFEKRTRVKNNIKIRFYFSSRQKPRRILICDGESFELEKTDFKIERRTVIIVHGFLSGGSQSWIKQMEDAFLLWGDVNIIVVDWSRIGKTVNYYKAAISTRIVGYEIARFLYEVVKRTIKEKEPYKPKWGKLHLIGHSLGSHITGVAAYDFHKMQNHWEVDRITGLDPALPCFNNISNAFRLDKSDARFVDIIHTSASVKSTIGFGNSEPMGHVDFYPNGGKRQPGCSRIQAPIFNYFWIPKTRLSQGSCSHNRPHVYFTESLIQAVEGSCTFWAHKWDRSYEGAVKLIGETCDKTNCTEMGIGAENHPHRGIFFVTTAQKSPFCVTNERSSKEIKRHLRIENSAK